MPSILKILLLTIALKTLVLSCSITSSYDLTFFVISSTNHWVTCGTNPLEKAIMSGYFLIADPYMPLIWGTYRSSSAYHCEMTKYFFVSGIPTGALVNVFTDDYTIMKINDVQVSSISTSAACTYQININIF